MLRPPPPPTLARNGCRGSVAARQRHVKALVHIEVVPDYELSGISGADLFLEYFFCRPVRAASIDRKRNIQAAFLGRRNLRAGSSMNS